MKSTKTIDLQSLADRLSKKIIDEECYFYNPKGIDAVINTIRLPSVIHKVLDEYFNK